MNIRESLSRLSNNRLSDVRYVRLVRMGFFEHELEGKSTFFYDEVMKDYKRRNAVYAKKNGVINIWKAPIQSKQVTYLAFFGYTITDEDHVTDAQARSLISIIQFAIDNARFIDAYASWVRDSTDTHRREFTDKDVDEVRKQLLEMGLSNMGAKPEYREDAYGESRGDGFDERIAM